MNEGDSESKSTIENSIEFTLIQLNSPDFKVVHDTIIQIRNLIIGNNKYKRFFMNESIVDRLIELIKKHHNTFEQKTASPIALINQIVVIFASYSLGSFESIVKLIKTHNIYKVLFDVIKHCALGDNSQEKLNLKIIESSLRCISNLYTTCQLSSSLIYELDKYLYSKLSDTETTYLDLLLKVYSLSNLTKQTVVQIVSISSSFITAMLFSSNRYVSNSTNYKTRKQLRMIKLNEQMKEKRSMLIKSDCIGKFANLLTSLLEPVQLNALKFYASICFENIEALDIILTSNYYECSLLDLISAYLSRENSAELQLNAAKCLVNMCRTLQILNNNKRKPSSKSSKMRSSSLKFKKLIKHKIDECPNYEDQDYEENEEYYQEEDVADDDEFNEEAEVEFNESDPENKTTASENAPIAESDNSQSQAKLESYYKHVDTMSPLIRFKTLPILIRLCCTFSMNYRNSNVNNPTLDNFVNSTSAKYYGTNKKKLPINTPDTEPTSQAYFMNMFLLIQSINTLTYLIELNSDLQATAGFLEQILPTLALNILEAYTWQKFDDSKSPVKNFKREQNQSRKNQLFQNLISSNKAKKTQTSENLADTTKFSIRNKSKNKSKEIEFSSLYSMFYLNYNQYIIKASQFKQNEHQYPRSVNCKEEKIEESETSEHNKPKSKILYKVNYYITNLEKIVHKRLAASSFHALSALASNNEVTRRQITENSSLVCRLIDSIQLTQTQIDGDSTSEQETDKIEEESKTKPLEETLDEEETNADKNIDSILLEIQSELNNESTEFMNDVEKCDEDFVNTLEDEFDDSNQTDSDILRLSGLCLLHSLSRSVHQLRTKFLDKKIWMPIIDLIKRSRKRRLEKNLLFLRYKRLRLIQIEQEKNKKLEASVRKFDEQGDSSALKETTKTPEDDFDELDLNDEDNEFCCDFDSINEMNLLAVTTAILANLLLEFSPSKEIMDENGIIKILVELVDHKNHSIRVNCMWALMNTAFQADQHTKQQIISTITMEKLFQLLTEQDDMIIMKTLGLIRNLITSRPHIDHIMSAHGTKIIQAIIMILEGEYYNVAIKEQALCILANVADGQTAKEFIMENEDLLRKINSFMTYSSIELQISSVSAVLNLVWTADEGAIERQSKLKDIGTYRILQRLQPNTDPLLFDKVEKTLQQFDISQGVAPVVSTIDE